MRSGNIMRAYACLLLSPDAILTPSLLNKQYQLLKKLYHNIEINLNGVDQYNYLDEAYDLLKSGQIVEEIDFTKYQQVVRTYFLNMSEQIRHSLYEKSDHLKIVALAGESLALIDAAASFEELINIYLSFLKGVASIKSIAQVKKQKKDRLVLRIVIIFVAITFVSLFYTIFVIMPMARYESAKTAALNGRFDEAYAMFISLGEYSDAKRQAELVHLHQLLQEKKHKEAVSEATRLDVSIDYQYVLTGGKLVQKQNETIASLDGYRFIDWDLVSYELENEHLSLKLKAVYELETYSISYLEVDSTDFPKEYDILTTIKLPSLEKFGYTFEGWSSTNGVVVKSHYLNKGTFGDLVLTPSFKANDYAIQINLDNGILPDDIPTTYNMDTDTIHIGAPQRDGYTFTGWTTNLSNELQESVDIPKGSFGTMQLFAHYIPNTYQISYQLDGGSGEMITSYTTDDGQVLRTPTRKGYTFTGWSDSEDGVPNPNYQLSYGDLDLKANWQINTYQIHLDPAGGDVGFDEVDATYLEEYHLPTPSRLGYNFEGWYYAGIKFEDDIYQYDYDLPLTAKWSARDDINYVVNHYWQNLDNDLFTLHEATVLFGVTDTKVKVQVNNYEGFVTPPIQELTIDPKGLLQVDYYYYRNSYNIYFFTNGGEAIDSITLKYGAYIDAPDAKRSNFTFGGWYMDMELSESFNLITMPGAPVYLYAWYEEEIKPSQLTFQMIDDNEETPREYYMITGFNGELPVSVVLPAYLGDIPILAIGEEAFIDANILEIRLPEQLLYMGKDVFNQANLIVYIPSGVETNSWSTWCDPTTIIYYE